MIFGNRSLRVALTLLGALAPWMAGAIDTGELIARIKVTAPATVAFTEVRFSRLLKKPLIVSGRMTFLGVDRLDQTIEKPYRESTEIRDTFVKVLREGERERTFALDRAPELRTLLQTFSALLSGDRSALERNFQTDAQSDAVNSNAWTLALTPLDPRLQRRLKNISLIGVDKAVHCFAVVTNEGASIMVLSADAGDTVLPAAGLPMTPDILFKRCRSARAA